LEKSLAADSADGRAVVNWLWLSLAQRKFGDVGESSRWFAKGTAWVDQLHAFQAKNLPMPGYHLHNYLEASVPIRELASPPARPIN